MISTKVRGALLDRLKETYHDRHHHFQLSMDTLGNHCRFAQGDKLVVKLSKNLTQILGFSYDIMIAMDTLALREMEALSNHLRQLHLLSIIIQPATYLRQTSTS